MKKNNYFKLVKNTSLVLGKGFIKGALDKRILAISGVTGMIYGLKYKEDFKSGVITSIAIASTFGLCEAIIDVKKDWNGIKADSYDYMYSKQY